MKNNSCQIILLFFLSILFFSCSKRQEARRPLKQISGEFIKKSVERNKKLNSNEEAFIENIIKKDSVLKYQTSQKGYWFAYLKKNDVPSLNPKKGDVAVFTYVVTDLKGNVIYNETELKEQNYIVDKQNIMIGLRDGIKLMQKNEKVKFIFPSNFAYGYHGDKNKIGSNVPLICTVTLKDILKEDTIKKNETKAVSIKNDSTQNN